MDGILLFDKPIHWTSHDAVDFIRRRIGQRAVGHAGTLDPLATGLLILLLGKSTKLSKDFSNLDKDYAGSMTLGMTTDTQDLEGRILSGALPENVRAADIERLFRELTGTLMQVPPRFSAVHQKGKKLYKWARKGVAVEEAPAREIRVEDFKLLRFSPPDIYFSLRCSKGTYVRTLCDVIGKRLGPGGVLSCLVRTRIGRFRLENALTEEKILAMSHENLSRLSGQTA
ncbi:MAG: tRNA pseudouridine(55) synthase TruB [Candidatus Omnitrophica bacterium]|nr:tRNA pseudouridine(55) synthase TruB [Candidatus Omnitrophota bacterium]